MISINYGSVVMTLFLSMVLIFSCSNQGNQNIDNEPTNNIIGVGNEIGKSVMKIYEDNSGNLWFGTRGNGVAKYDGSTLTYLTEEDGLCGNHVADITEDNEGNIWFGTHSDMCKYNGQSFTSFPRDKDNMPTLGWGWKSVMTDKNGKLWVNTHQGIFECIQNGNSAKNIKFEKLEVPLDIEVKEESSFCNTPGIVSLDLVDANDNMWFGTDGLGVYKFDGKSYTHFTKADGLPSNNIKKIIEDQNGNIWFTCIDALEPNKKGEGGIACYNGNEIVTFEDVKGLNNINILSVFEDKKGNIWTIAESEGVYKYDGKEFKLYALPNGQNLRNDFGMHTIMEDKNQSMWFGFAGCLFRLDNESLVSINQDGPW